MAFRPYVADTTIPVDPTNLLAVPATATNVHAALEALSAAITANGVSPQAWGTEMQWFASAMANRANQLVRVVAVGDSITEGYYALTRPATWTQVFGDTVCAAVGQPVGHSRYLPAAIGGYLPWTSGGGAAANNYFGLGNWATYLTSAGPGWIERTEMCDRITVAYPKYNILPGTLDVVIDSASATTLNQNGAYNGGYTWTSGDLGWGSHTVRLQPAAGSPNVEGVYFHRSDHTTGVQVWQGGHASASTNYFRQPASGSGWAWTDGFHNGYPPDLVIIGLGSNDLFWGWPGSTTQAYLEQTIDLIRTGSTTDPSIALVVPPNNSFNGGDFTGLRRTLYRTAQATGAAVIDLLQAMGTDADNSLGYYYEGTHPNARGQRRIGETIAGWVLNAVGLVA